jgi:hypothetical protein
MLTVTDEDFDLFVLRTCWRLAAAEIGNNNSAFFHVEPNC